jgi:ATP-binding cassette subfamily B protein
VPAIAVTAYATPQHRALALKAGFQRHLAKPVDPEVLIDTIHEIARSKGKG